MADGIQPGPKNHPLFPVLMALGSARVVVIGGGRVAERKVGSLLECGASVEVIAPELCPRLLELAQAGRITFTERTYRPGDLTGAVLAIAAVDDLEAGAAVAKEAARLGIPVNIVDRPELCTFIVPSLLRRGPLTIAVSTGGTSPAWARRIRESLEGEFGPEYARLFEALRSVRHRCLREIPDSSRRTDILKRLTDEAVLELARTAKAEQLESAIWAYLGLDDRADSG
jgi:precorrin-2 dehydrogenase/sirohydrochlorin ferrochelatase